MTTATHPNLTYRCPHCGTAMEVDPRLAEEMLTCPNEACGKPFRADVPSAEPLPEQSVDAAMHGETAPVAQLAPRRPCRKPSCKPSTWPCCAAIRCGRRRIWCSGAGALGHCRRLDLGLAVAVDPRPDLVGRGWIPRHGLVAAVPQHQFAHHFHQVHSGERRLRQGNRRGAARRHRRPASQQVHAGPAAERGRHRGPRQQGRPDPADPRAWRCPTPKRWPA